MPANFQTPPVFLSYTDEEAVDTLSNSRGNYPLKKKNNRFTNRCLFFLLNITRYNSFFYRAHEHTFFSFFPYFNFFFTLTSLYNSCSRLFHITAYYHHRSHISLMELYVEYIFFSKSEAQIFLSFSRSNKLVVSQQRALIKQINDIFVNLIALQCTLVYVRLKRTRFVHLGHVTRMELASLLLTALHYSE